MEINQEVKDLLLKYFKLYRNEPNLEIEFRLGYNEENTFNVEMSKFTADISKMFFDKIYSQLDESSVFNNKYKEYTDTFYSISEKGEKSSNNKNKNNKQIRKSSDSTQFIKKTKLCKIDLSYEPFDVRISFSIEEPVSGPVQGSEASSEVIYMRNKSRNSFEYKYWSYDLTKVIHKENSLDITKYEVELEIKDTLIGKDDDFLEYLVESSLLKIKDMANMCEANNSIDFEIIREVARS